MEGRVNVIEGSGSSNSSNVLTPVKWRTTETSEQRTNDTVSVNEVRDKLPRARGKLIVNSNFDTGRCR